MNNWSFSGNLGKDAETRYTAGGEAIVNFSVAVKAGYGDKAITTWVRCSIFGKRGDAVAQYLTKGQLVGVTGEAALRPWKDKDGVEKQSLEVRVNDLTLLGKSDGAKPASAPAQPDKAPTGSFEDFADDIPFN